jgi:molybdenum cofactor cytidylyltransferase
VRVFAILPAAGRSRRMGRPKLLLPWRDTTIIGQVVRNWQASRVDQVIAVVHPDDFDVAEQCAEALVVAPQPPPAEMKDSIQHGLAAAEAQCNAGDGDVWLVAPADMPGLEPEVINAVIAAYERDTAAGKEEKQIWIASHQGRRGHPVLLPWQMARDVEELGADQGLKAVVARYPVRLVEVNSTAIFADIDTPEDYQAQRPEP